MALPKIAFWTLWYEHEGWHECVLPPALPESRHSTSICFIDNEASRISVIKKSSRSRAMFALVNFLSLVDSQAPFMAWIERVPTHSNPAGLPSRGCEQELADKTGAENLGDICLPGLILNFLCSKEFHKDLANVIIFESAV